MTPQLKIVRIDIGPLTVAYRREKREWLATALQFDIVGSGKTRLAAFKEMKELVSEYLAFMLGSKEKIALFNPSAREEWEAPIKESYDIFVVLSLPAKVKELTIEPRSMRMDEIRPVRKRVRQFELTPIALHG